MTRVYLVRHGTTEWNREEIFRGRADCPLNAAGRAEARAVARYFQGTRIDALYASPLARAAQTAEAIAAGRGLQAAPAPDFIDLDFGRWQGRSRKEVREADPRLYRAWRERPQEVAFPGGESLGEARARAWAGLLRVAGENPDRTAVVVSHRVILKVLICAALGLDDSHFWQVRQDPAAVNCLERVGDKFVVSLLNDTCHLNSIGPSGAQEDF